jgi:hypothetical protein
MLRIRITLGLALAPLMACTLVTGANDYKVDAAREQEEKDREAESKVRDLDYEMSMMSEFHAGTPLDVAVVDQDDVMQARARIMLAPVGQEEVEHIHLDKALTPGPQRLFFYVDSNQNYKIDGTMNQIIEHIWVKPVNPDGTGMFVHSTMFQFFTEQDFAILNGNVLLKFPTGPAATLNDAQRRCLQKQIEQAFDDTFEVKIYLASEDRQVGLFKTYKNGALPSDDQIKLVGILDAGNTYHIQTVFDGNVKKELDRTAPQSGDIVVEAKDWLPLTLDVLACLKPIP